jgi:hypothetical protein
VIQGDGNTLTKRDLMVTLMVAALGYFRWTQLVPMLMAWSFLLIMLGALVLVNFQEETFSVLAYVDDLYMRYVEADPAVDGAADQPAAPAAASSEPADVPVPAPDSPGADVEAAAGSPAPGAVTFDGDDLEGWVWRAWAVAALVGWVLGGVWRQLFGAPEPWTLRRKLVICAVLAGVCSIAFLGIWRLSPEDYNGSAFGWVALFVGVPVGVWLVSAWSLTISHLLGRFADHIDAAAREGAGET